MQDIQEVSRQRVWDAYTQLVRSLTSSDLMELPGGASYRHCSSAVLLRGSIRTSAAHCIIISKAKAAGAPSCLRQCASRSLRCACRLVPNFPRQQPHPG